MENDCQCLSSALSGPGCPAGLFPRGRSCISIVPPSAGATIASETCYTYALERYTISTVSEELFMRNVMLKLGVGSVHAADATVELSTCPENNSNCYEQIGVACLMQCK